MGPTLGDDFPDLRGETQITRNFSLHEYFGNRWGIVFMHPADFTPVCTTEIGAAQSLIDEFEARDVRICGFSCDDASRHCAWIDDIEAATGQRVTFPLFCDPSRMSAIELGVFDPALKDDEGLPLTVRQVFIINPRKKVALTMTYPSCVGRNFDEILRVVDALQRADKFNVATPANWSPGDKTIVDLGVNDEEAADGRFGKNGYTTVDLPSERGKQLNKHYLRYTDDPVFASNSKQSTKLAIHAMKPKMSWRPPKSFALSLNLRRSNRKNKRGQDSADENDAVHVQGPSAAANGPINDTATTTTASRSVAPIIIPANEKSAKRPSVDYGNHRSWKVLLRPFTSLRSEATSDRAIPLSNTRRASKSGDLSSIPPLDSYEESGDLLVGFGKKQNIDDDSHVVW